MTAFNEYITENDDLTLNEICEDLIREFIAPLFLTINQGSVNAMHNYTAQLSQAYQYKMLKRDNESMTTALPDYFQQLYKAKQLGFFIRINAETISNVPSDKFDVISFINRLRNNAQLLQNSLVLNSIKTIKKIPDLINTEEFGIINTLNCNRSAADDFWDIDNRYQKIKNKELKNLICIISSELRHRPVSLAVRLILEIQEYYLQNDLDNYLFFNVNHFDFSCGNKNYTFDLKTFDQNIENKLKVAKEELQDLFNIESNYDFVAVIFEIKYRHCKRYLKKLIAEIEKMINQIGDQYQLQFFATIVVDRTLDSTLLNQFKSNTNTNFSYFNNLKELDRDQDIFTWVEDLEGNTDLMDSFILDFFDVIDFGSSAKESYQNGKLKMESMEIIQNEIYQYARFEKENL